MSKTFFFSFEVTPLPDNPDYGQFQGALAHILVVDSTQEIAEGRARNYLNEYMLVVDSLDKAFETNESHYHDRPEGLLLYHKAQRHGLAMGLVAY